MNILYIYTQNISLTIQNFLYQIRLIILSFSFYTIKSLLVYEIRKSLRAICLIYNSSTTVCVCPAIRIISFDTPGRQAKSACQSIEFPLDLFLLFVSDCYLISFEFKWKLVSFHFSFFLSLSFSKNLCILNKISLTVNIHHLNIY